MSNAFDAVKEPTALDAAVAKFKTLTLEELDATEAAVSKAIAEDPSTAAHNGLIALGAIIKAVKGAI